jgi:tetratricopeptide (TPR) repeat protein
VRSTNRKTLAIWNILAKNGLSPAAVGWWASYPAEDVGPGVMVSDALAFHGFGRTAREGDDGLKTYPSEFFPEVDALIPPEQQVQPEFAQRFIRLAADEYQEEKFDPAKFPKHDPDNPIHLFQQYAITAEGYTAIAEKLLSERDDDLVMLYFEQVDSFSHLFMKYVPPKLAWLDEEDFERYRDVVLEWYRYQDELLGRILEQIDLDETAVFILSDHGFKSGDRRIRSEKVVDINKAHLDHETEGIFLAAGPHIRRGGEVSGASVLDLTPTVLYYLGLPVGKDMDGKVLEGVFDPSFIKRHPIRYVSTHEDGQRQKALARASTDGALEAADQAGIEAQLQALGYIEPTADDEAAQESSPEIHNNLGRIFLGEGEPEKARREFEKALKLDPNNAEALLNMAAIHQGEGKVDKAEHLVQRALAVNPNSIGALAQLAEIQRDQGELDESIRLFSEALAIDDAHPFLWIGIGDVLQRAGRFEPAVEAFRSVLELDPDSFNARYNLGVTYSNMGREDEAMAIYEEALARAPKHPKAPAARNNLGALHLARGETDQALAHFEAALGDAPYNLESRYNVAMLYLETGRQGEAIALLEEAAELEPNHEPVNLLLGFAYLDAGRGDEAYRRFLLVRRLYPSNWSALVGMAVLHARAQEDERARSLLQEALSQGGPAANQRAANFPILGTLRAP